MDLIDLMVLNRQIDLTNRQIDLIDLMDFK
jgi:hypothetical protein